MPILDFETTGETATMYMQFRTIEDREQDKIILWERTATVCSKIQYQYCSFTPDVKCILNLVKYKPKHRKGLFSTNT